MTRLGGHQHAIEQKHHLSQSLAEQSSPLVSCVFSVPSKPILLRSLSKSLNTISCIKINIVTIII
ncbi:hypothetical protein Hanom_Chr17g01578811 [Helianthus anomalus]